MNLKIKKIKNKKKIILLMDIFKSTYIYFTYPNEESLFTKDYLFITKIIFIKHDWNILISKIYQSL